MTSTCTRVFSLIATVVSLSGIAYAQQTPPTDPKPAETKPAETKPAETKTAPPVAGPPAPPANQPRPRPNVPPTTMVKPKPLPKLPPNIVARVGDENITRDDLMAMFNMVAGRPLVDQLVQAVLVEQEAKKLGVTVTAEELNKATDEAKLRIVAQQSQMGQPMTFKEIADREGFNDDLIRWSVRLDILRRKTFGKSVENQVPGRDDQMHLAHILMATVPLPKQGDPPPTPLTPEEQTKKDAEAKAKVEALLADIKEGRKTWDLAAKESEDTSNNQTGGDLGWYPKGQLDPDFEAAAFSIPKSGDIIGPVKSRFGWHLIKLIQKGTELSPAEKAAYRKEQVAMMQANPQMLNNWLGNLRNKYTVNINRQVQLVPGARLPVRMLQVTPTKVAPAKATPAKTTSKSK